MALFENFPYTNIHELNLDWIVKIAKDFLEQYTHIQQLIEDGETSLVNLKNEGLAELQEKADALEAALQAWYDTHSEDIAQQLASALADLNAWYTQHEGYLDQYVANSIASFNTQADQKAVQTIASIPSDYTALSSKVGNLKTNLDEIIEETTLENYLYKTDYYVNSNTHAETELAGFDLYRIPCQENDFVFVRITNLSQVWYQFTTRHAVNMVKNDDTYISISDTQSQAPLSNNYFYVPADLSYALIVVIVPSDVKAISISVYSGYSQYVEFNINRKYPYIRPGKTYPVLSLPYELTDEVAIKSKLYRQNNSDLKYSWVSDPAATLSIKVKPGDFIHYSQLPSPITYYASFVPDSNPEGRAIQITTPDYFFTESGWLASFIINDNYNAYITPAEFTQYYNKQGVALGTSLTYRAQTTGGYLQFLPDMLHAEIDNQGIGSSVIYPHGDYPNMLTRILNYPSYANKDFCILEGFVNDWGLSNTLGTWKDTGTISVCGCVRTAINHIVTQNPNITLILVLDPIGQDYGGVENSSLTVKNGKTQKEFYDEISKVAECMGIPCIKLYEDSQMSELTPSMYIDNIHPSARGALQTAMTIYKQMKLIPIKARN